jgi:hypothetical protein
MGEKLCFHCKISNYLQLHKLFKVHWWLFVPPALTLQNSEFCLYFVGSSEQTTIISVNSIGFYNEDRLFLLWSRNWIFICDLSERYSSFTAASRSRTRSSPCGICCGWRGSGTNLSPTSLLFSCQYHSTKVRCLSSCPKLLWTEG